MEDDTPHMRYGNELRLLIDIGVESEVCAIISIACEVQDTKRSLSQGVLQRHVVIRRESKGTAFAITSRDVFGQIDHLDSCFAEPTGPGAASMITNVMRRQRRREIQISDRVSASPVLNQLRTEAELLSA